MKRLFDAIRRIKGAGLTQSEVDAINAALEGRVTPDSPSRAENKHVPQAIGPHGMQIIKDFEGCHKIMGDGRVASYPDPGTGGKPWTIGWGATKGLDYKPIKPGEVMTQAQVDHLLERDVRDHAKDVVRALNDSPTSQKQFDALVSFHFNTGAINRSTLLRKHKAGDFVGAANEFKRWNRAGGRVLRGLTRRRKAEAELYRQGS